MPTLVSRLIAISWQKQKKGDIARKSKLSDLLDLGPGNGVEIHLSRPGAVADVDHRDGPLESLVLPRCTWYLRQQQP